MERLFKYLMLLDQDIEIVIKQHKKSRRVKGMPHLHLQVLYAEGAA